MIVRVYVNLLNNNINQTPVTFVPNQCFRPTSIVHELPAAPGPGTRQDPTTELSGATNTNDLIHKSSLSELPASETASDDCQATDYY